MTKLTKNGHHHRPPAKQRPHHGNDNQGHVISSGQVSPMNSERMRGNPGPSPDPTRNHHTNVSKYEPTPGGQSPRLQHHGGNASTLDEINHGSPVPSRRHELSQPPSHHYNGSSSPKLAGKQNGAVNHGERS